MSAEHGKGWDGQHSFRIGRLHKPGCFPGNFPILRREYFLLISFFNQDFFPVIALIQEGFSHLWSGFPATSVR